MFLPSALTTFFALDFLTEYVITIPRPPSSSDPTVSLPLISSTSLVSNISKVSWGNCASFGVNSTDPNFRCGFLDVPMDYHDSSAGTARLAVIKYAATVPRKKGTVFFNPGDALYLFLTSLG